MPDIEAAWGRIEAWLGENALRVLAGLAPGAAEDQIAATESALGVVFPDEVRTSYRRHDGQVADSSGGGGFTAGGDLLSLSGILEAWELWKELSDAGEFDGNPSDPDPGVRAGWWNPKWVPIASNGSGDYQCLDLDPSPGGTAGQILSLWHDYEARSVVADSLTDWLTQLADSYDLGEWAYSERYRVVARAEDL